MNIILLTADVDAILSPLNILLQIVLSVFSGIGIFICAKGIGDFAEALPAKDSSGMSRGAMTFAGGLLMIGLQVVLNVMGIL